MTILDHLSQLNVIEERKTYLVCDCPSCKEPRLKISTRPSYYGAYKCWSGCSTEQVRSAMSLEKTKNYYLSPYKKTVPQTNYKSNLKLDSIKSQPFQGSKICVAEFQPIETSTKRFLQAEKTITIYPYSDTQRIYRLDGPSGKEIYLQYQNRDSIWEAGVGNASWPLYTRGLTVEPLLGDTALFVEGEKTCEALKEEGYAAVTAASHCYNQDALYKSIYLFTRKYKYIKNIIIVPDDDTPGQHKANLVSKMFSHFKVGNKIVSMDKIASTFGLTFVPNQGTDLADFDLREKKLDLQCLTN